ncbi:MAG: helix-turn-helix domain-containing protein, partial [Desulfobacterales bacterium]
LERRHIERVLEVTGGNRPKAARILGINPSTIYRKLEKYNLIHKNSMQLDEAGQCRTVWM